MMDKINFVLYIPNQSSRCISVAKEDIPKDVSGNISAIYLYTLVSETIRAKIEDIRLSLDSKNLSIDDCVPESYINHVSFCILHILYRLRGGKGGFGALLKKQRRRVKANFSIDACRDLTGRRIGQAQLVDRIKQWMQKKAAEDNIIDTLKPRRNPKDDLKQQVPKAALDKSYFNTFNKTRQIVSVAMEKGVERAKKLQTKMEKLESRRRSKSAVHNDSFKYMYGDEDDMHSEDDAIDSDSGSEISSVEDNNDVATSSINEDDNTHHHSTSSARGDTEYTNSSVIEEVDNHTSVSTVEDMPVAKDTKASNPLSALEELYKESQKESQVEKASKKNEIPQDVLDAIDVSKYKSKEQLLRALDPEVIKAKLVQIGWKCGGTPEERAARLFLYKAVQKGSIPVPKNVLAKPKP